MKKERRKKKFTVSHHRSRSKCLGDGTYRKGSSLKQNGFGVWGFFCTHVDGYILVINKTTHASELIFFFGNGMQEAFGYQKKLIRWVILAITSVCNDSFTS